MIKQILLVSGPVSSGKTTLCDLLVSRFGILIFKTREHLKTLQPSVVAERSAMQALGEQLDRTTKGAWVGKGLMERIRELDNQGDLIIAVDAVRIRNQINFIRQAYGSKVIHIHLDAPNEILEERYQRRVKDGLKEFGSYEEVRQNRTESKVRSLRKYADVVIDTKRCTKEDVMIKVASHLGLYGRECLRLADVLIGGQYGSEGKGHIASFLAKEYDLLVRVGGPNAGHTVYSEPKPYTFHHLPSGTLAAPNAKLLIGPGATVYIPGLLQEISDCKIHYERLSVDPQTMIITEWDRKREESLKKSMGSTGQGGGSAAARRIINRQPGKVKLAQDFPRLKPYIRNTSEILEDAFRNCQRVFLEGTQGTGLSLYHGNYPYVTSRDTTVAGCLAEAGISPTRTRKIIMVCRTYPIRVQSPKGRTSGSMSQELKWSEIESRSGYTLGKLEEKELTSTTRRRRRVGEFEWTLFRKSASLNAPTDIALTFVDYISIKNLKARRFEQLTTDTIRFIEEVEKVAAAPVSLISTRFNYRSIIDRRAW